MISFKVVGVVSDMEKVQQGASKAKIKCWRKLCSFIHNILRWRAFTDTLCQRSDNRWSSLIVMFVQNSLIAKFWISITVDHCTTLKFVDLYSLLMQRVHKFSPTDSGLKQQNYAVKKTNINPLERMHPSLYNISKMSFRVHFVHTHNHNMQLNCHVRSYKKNLRMQTTKAARILSNGFRVEAVSKKIYEVKLTNIILLERIYPSLSNISEI